MFWKEFPKVNRENFFFFLILIFPSFFLYFWICLVFFFFFLVYSSISQSQLFTNGRDIYREVGGYVVVFQDTVIQLPGKQPKLGEKVGGYVVAFWSLPYVYSQFVKNKTRKCQNRLENGRKILEKSKQKAQNVDAYFMREFSNFMKLLLNPQFQTIKLCVCFNSIEEFKI